MTSGYESQVFDEYDIAIAASNRSRFGSSSSSDPLPLGAETEHSSAGGDNRGAQFERAVKDYVPESDGMTGRLRRAVIDYGYTVAVFHVGISLASLGIFVRRRVAIACYARSSMTELHGDRAPHGRMKVLSQHIA